METSLRAILKDWEDEPRNDKLYHRWADKSDSDHLTQSGFSAEQVHTYFDQGGRAAISTKDGKPVGSFWMFPETKVFDKWFRVDAALDEIISWQVYVDPEFRGERWFREIRRFVFPQLIDDGYERMLGIIDALNRSYLHAGARPERRNVGRIFCIRLLGLSLFHINRRWGCGF